MGQGIGYSVLDVQDGDCTRLQIAGRDGEAYAFAVGLPLSSLPSPIFDRDLGDEQEEAA